MNCKMCGGEAVRMGQLGDRVWYRCRDCGWEQSQHKTEEENAEG